ncbi:hypothetical protein GCM10010317_016950 [Streptomyces mirabilis]|nr:hypothetical protein GCM10010317_016950 [Streptomyces mirabilis]
MRMRALVHTGFCASGGSVPCAMMAAMNGHVAMSEQASDWVTLFRFENVPGCPRPGRLMAV